MSSPPPLPKVAIAVIALSVLLYGCFNHYYFIFANNWALVPGDLGDARLEVLLLEHSHNWLIGDVFGSFWGPAWNFSPQPNSLAMSDIMLGSIPLYSPWRFLGFDPWISFQFWVVAAGVANFICMLMLGLNLGLSPIASTLAGYVFAFSLPRAGYLNHAQLMAHWWTPLAANFFISACRARNLGKHRLWLLLVVGAGLCFAAQFWSAFYLGWFAVVGIIGFILFSALVFPKRLLSFSISNFKPLVVFGFVFGVTALPLALRYLEMAKIMGERPKSVIVMSLPQMSSWFLPADSSTFYSVFFNALIGSYPDFGEYVMFPGMAPLLAVTFCFIMIFKGKRFASSAGWIGALSFFAVFFMTTKFGKNTLWNLFIDVIPGAKAIRAMSRISLSLLLPLGLSTGFIWDHLLSRRGYIFAILFASFVITEQAHHNKYGFEKSGAILRGEQIAHRIDSSCDYFYNLNPNEPEFITHLDAMWASLLTRVPTLNGYSGGEHPKYRELEIGKMGQITEDKLKSWVAYWGAKNGKICVVSK